MRFLTFINSLKCQPSRQVRFHSCFESNPPNNISGVKTLSGVLVENIEKVQGEKTRFRIQLSDTILFPVSPLYEFSCWLNHL